MTARPQNKGRTTRTKTSRHILWLIGLIVLLAVGGIYWFVKTRALQSESVAQFMHLHGLAVAPWAPEDTFVSTHEGLLRISSEGEWRYVSEVQHDFMGFQANPTGEGVLYSSGHPAPGSELPNPLGFMVSRDGGVTWRVASLAGQVDFHTMAVQPNNGEVVYGFSHDLWRSIDGGKTWEQVETRQLAALGNIYALAVHPDDPDTVLAGTQGGLWRSTDGGGTWENVIARTPVTAVAYSPGNPKRLFAYVVAEGAGLVQSTDGGSNWETLGLLLEGEDAVGYITPHPTEPDTLFAGSYGQHLLKTSNGGKDWHHLAEAGVPYKH